MSEPQQKTRLWKGACLVAALSSVCRPWFPMGKKWKIKGPERGTCKTVNKMELSFLLHSLQHLSFLKALHKSDRHLRSFCFWLERFGGSHIIPLKANLIRSRSFLLISCFSFCWTCSFKLLSSQTSCGRVSLGLHPSLLQLLWHKWPLKKFVLSR